MPAVNVTRNEWVWQALKPGNFMFWLSRARAGQKLVYHIGNLAAERHKIIANGQTRNIEPLNTVAKEAWHAMEQGYVILTQKRLGENLFQYEARVLEHRRPVQWIR